MSDVAKEGGACRHGLVSVQEDEEPGRKRLNRRWTTRRQMAAGSGIGWEAAKRSAVRSRRGPQGTGLIGVESWPRGGMGTKGCGASSRRGACKWRRCPVARGFAPSDIERSMMLRGLRGQPRRRRSIETGAYARKPQPKPKDRSAPLSNKGDEALDKKRPGVARPLCVVNRSVPVHPRSRSETN